MKVVSQFSVRILVRSLTALLLGLVSTSTIYAKDKLPEPKTDIEALCHEIGGKLGSVSIKDCLAMNLKSDGVLTPFKRPLTYKDFPPIEGKPPRGRVLLMGGIHGDEYSAISIMFKWLDKLNKYHSGLFDWRVVPLLNPDGLLQFDSAQRQNGRGVDLNRNFPSADWDELAHDYWINKTHRNPRRFPGETSTSERETQWFVGTMEYFQPDVIIAVHAPHSLIDYDGPDSGPERLGNLRLNRLGIYPGSLGNYGGVDLKIPVVTIELPHAGIMPSDAEVTQMWNDLVRWLVANLEFDKQ